MLKLRILKQYHIKKVHKITFNKLKNNLLIKIRQMKYIKMIIIK
jgi:hypothetical protein